MIETWTPDSWRALPAKHMPEYSEPGALDAVLATLRTRPPLVSAGEARMLKARLADVAAGRAFLLQGGDCAESFAEFNTDNVMSTFRVLLQMAVVLTFAGNKPVVKIGRIAGQFAKPRSAATETIDGETLPSYLGDNINGMAFTAAARRPDPQHLLTAYAQSASTLNFIRALAVGGYADLSEVHRWTLDFVSDSPQAQRYENLARQIDEAVGFMSACGINPESTPQMHEVNFFTSHEALHLPFEAAMTRVDSTSGHPPDDPHFYDTSAHFLWIGDRTRQPDGAHVEFLRGIKNPIGLKCGPSLAPNELLKLIDILNPEREPGRLTLIARFGADKVEAGLPKLARAVVQALGVEQTKRAVVWSCDPMHGNTIKTSSGFKTRPFDAVLAEIDSFMRILPQEGAIPGGVHVEMTGRNVTECTGGGQDISEAQLGERYDTHCDPRLNGAQALELAFRVAERLRGARARVGKGKSG
jgi:3-deoxy-7-phosphoheptulonate synthase